MVKDTPLGVRVTPELKAALARAAADDMRSMASLAEKILTEWLRERGYLSPVKAGRARKSARKAEG